MRAWLIVSFALIVAPLPFLPPVSTGSFEPEPPLSNPFVGAALPSETVSSLLPRVDFSALSPPLLHENSDSPITIVSDDDFLSYGFDGSGSFADPYLIENLTIVDAPDNGITVANTTKHFIIRNCTIFNSGGDSLFLTNIQNDTVGIYNNTILASHASGIYVENTDSVYIANTTCNANMKRGIHIFNSASSLFSCTLTNNICSHNYYQGFYIVNVHSSSFLNNTCTYNGFSSKHEGFMLTDSSSSSVQNLLCSYNYDTGLHINNSDHISFLNTTCSFNGDDGMSISYSPHTSLINNSCVNNTNIGFFLYSCPFSTLIGNRCMKSRFYALWISESPTTFVSDNFCTDTLSEGMFIEYSTNSTIINNLCSGNRYSGLWLYSKHCLVLNNTLTNNGDGILLDWGDHNILAYNWVEGNTRYGINIDWRLSDKNLIHHNNMVDNGIQANEQSKDNLWYEPETQEGNYWSDWDGNGAYKLNGVVDKYPLSQPTTYTGWYPDNPVFEESSIHWLAIFLPILGGVILLGGSVFIITQKIR